MMTSVSSSMLIGLISTMSALSQQVIRDVSLDKPTEALIAYIEIPKVDSQVIRRDVRFPVGIY